MDKYQNIFFSSPTIMIIVDSETGDIIEVNQAAIDYYGYSAEELLRFKIFDISIEEPLILNKWMKNIDRPQTFFSKHILKEGYVRDVHIFFGIVTLFGKKHINLTIIDVTDQLQTDKHLKECYERLNLVLAGTGAGVWEYDLVNNKNYVDNQWKAILGYDENELTDEVQEWRSRWHIDDEDKIIEAMRSCEEGKTDHFELEYRLLHKDGSYRWVRSIGKIIFNKQRKPIRALGTMSDITKVKEAEDGFEVVEMLKFTYETQRKSDFINGILSGVTCDEKTLKEFGIDFNKPLYCCLIHVLEGNDKNHKDHRNANHSKSLMNQLIYQISTYTNYLAWNNRDKIGVLCQDPSIQDSKDMWHKSMTAASELKKILCNDSPNLIISIGISDLHCGASSINNCYQEACNTLFSAQCQMQAEGGIFHYQDAGLFQILSLIYGKSYALDYVHKMIGSLIENDNEKGSDFLITLEEIIQSNNLKDAAKRLFIHYKTLVFRKRRIEKILGVSLDHSDTRLALAAAIKLHKLMMFNNATMKD